ncbi:MAG: hypothetical protein IPH07_07690 [Deltaproteobacteria bacterium]|nr:hypothetical protein [Deltaproteobacteria bacterium]MBK8236619.1 hypothetical protein [Deltaproteobacteria bacterium]MBK8717754.1 hypothetical protein [Deltaproteobacteria bacterium]MBP7288804.1 hypothetical protein [Nannocystaceae bacterium]
MDLPAPTPRRSARRLLLGLAVVVVALSAVFGVTTVRQQRRFRDYREQTLADAVVPWTSAELGPEACVAFGVEWAMGCPGLGTWCENEAPVVVGRCMASRDRSGWCRAKGDALFSTDFGVKDCEQLRASVDGKYAQRAHKKFCAAAQRALAEHCR